MLAAVWAEHFAFAKLFGVYPFRRAAEKPSSAFKIGAIALIAASAALAAAWLTYDAVWAYAHFRTAVYVLLMLAFIWLGNIMARKYAPDFHATSGIFYPLMMLNCTVSGALLVSMSASDGYSLVRLLLYGAMSAVGFTFAVMIFTGLRERLVFATPAKILRGIPIAIAAAGLVAMALMGLRGIDVAEIIMERI